MSKKNKYSLKEISSKSEEVEDFISEYGTVYHSYDYLTSVGSDYKCYIVKSDDSSALVVMPLVKSSKYKLKSYNLPPLSYLYGPVLKEIDEDKMEYVITLLFRALKDDLRVDLKCYFNKNIMPYSNNGYNVIARQSHIFPKDLEYSRSVLNKDKRKALNKLEKLLDEGEIKLIEGEEALDYILGLYEITSKRAKFAPNTATLRKIMSSGIKYYSNLIISKHGEPLAGAFCPYDNNTMYYMAGVGNRDVDSAFAKSNVLSLNLAIDKANKLGLDFDYVGSEIKGVTDFNRSMGGRPIIIYNCVRTNSLYYKVVDFIKSII